MSPQVCGRSKITQWLGCRYTEEQQQGWSCTMRIFPSLLVLPTEEWQQVNIISGDKGKIRWFQHVSMPMSSGGNENCWLCEAKSLLQTSFTKDSRTTLYNNWLCAHVPRIFSWTNEANMSLGTRLCLMTAIKLTGVIVIGASLSKPHTSMLNSGWDVAYHCRYS